MGSKTGGDYVSAIQEQRYISEPIEIKLRGLSPHANYTDRAAAAGRRS